MKAPPLHLAPGAELRINGTLQVVRAISDTGAVTLECPVRRTATNFSLSELVTMRMSGTLEPVHVLPITHTVTGTPTLELLDRAEGLRISRRVAYAQAGAREFPIGPKSVRLRALIDEVATRLGDASPPSPHSVYRWLRRYVTSGYDTAVFMQDATVTRTRRPRVLTDEITDSLRQHIEDLLGAFKGATLSGITNLALAKTAKDAGFVRFLTKEGTDELVDSFIQTAERLLVERATSKARSRSDVPTK